MTVLSTYGRLTVAENTLIISNVFTGKRLCIEQPYDFVLYLGDKADMRELASADFALKERAENNSVMREYTRENLRVSVTYASEKETFVKRVRIKSETPVKLCKICLLGGSSSSEVSRGGKGQPVFFGGGFWGGIEFPAALNNYENDTLCFMQAPYERTDDFECFPAVFGIDACGDVEKNV